MPRAGRGGGAGTPVASRCTFILFFLVLNPSLFGGIFFSFFLSVLVTQHGITSIFFIERGHKWQIVIC